MANLNKRNKKECQIILAMLIQALFMQETDKLTGNDPTENPAISNCMAMIDELFAKHNADPATLRAMRLRVDAHRKRFTRKVKHLPLECGLVGALQYLTSGNIKTKAGTRLDYIVTVFAQNLKLVKDVVEFEQDKADEFEALFKTAIIGIG
jgi:hypothetical protein